MRSSIGPRCRAWARGSPNAARSRRRRWSGRSRRSAAWSTRRRTAAPCGSPRSAPPDCARRGNRAAVIAAIRAGTGLTVEVIPGEEEGRLAYLAVQTGLGIASGNLVVFDTGGGSSQFTFGHGGPVDEQFSVPVGAVRYTERFGLAGVVTPAVLDDARAAIAAELASIDDRPAPDALVGMGGAVTNITAVKHGLAVYDPDVVQGTVLDRAEIDRQIELYRSRDADGRRAIVGLQPKRADVILAGALIVRTVMTKLGQGVTDGQRPRTAPRAARRSLRSLGPGKLRPTSGPVKVFQRLARLGLLFARHGHAALGEVGPQLRDHLEHLARHALRGQARIRDPSG